ncbi:phosphoribosyltransferase-like protein [Ornithinimicrobium cerasi]|uniref:PRTase-CE domain-containing protein n=1 Tax=Ornithinimicrobium cerasi TaxID=2248773 RepID=A0A285VWE7_9MICO|nr:hypothetical protein [Ornithinimicrobium cerasi]SOC58364.1 hypothetical protein SAMN05421879_1318 [Ornithinimicrobium cerasi]
MSPVTVDTDTTIVDSPDEPLFTPQPTQLMIQLFNEFEPTSYEGKDFQKRRIEWLTQADTEQDQELLKHLLSRLYYVSRMEYRQLMTDAFRGPIRRWHLDLLGRTTDFEIAHSDYDATWFTAISDSLEIARFHHVNRLQGKRLRPDWRTLTKLGDREAIANFCRDKGIQQIVILEDFVGTGAQAEKAIRFACETLPERPILFVPLIVCPSGHERIQELTSEYMNLHYSPFVVAPSAAILGPVAGLDENARDAELRQLVRRTARRTTKDAESPFGYMDTGALIVLFTNCPNNTLPIIHNETSRWRPLFPRSVR